MQYRWDNYSLDRDGALLMRQGQQVDVSRKVLVCISHLVEHRERVVSYDELIRKVWGHDNATNNQLSQVIVAARRALGDDNQAQRLSRTMPGLGYGWVGALREGPDADAGLMQTGASVRMHSAAEVIARADATDTTPAAHVHTIAPIAATSAASAMGSRSRTLRLTGVLALVLALVGVAGIGGRLQKIEPTAVTAQPAVLV